MKLLVCGSRKWKDHSMIFNAMRWLNENVGIDEVIEGCARGADKNAEFWAKVNLIPVKHFPANWTAYGKKAGVMRNIEMLKYGPDFVLAFHDDITGSAGTGHMVKIAEREGIPVVVMGHNVEREVIDE